MGLEQSHTGSFFSFLSWRQGGLISLTISLTILSVYAQEQIMTLIVHPLLIAAVVVVFVGLVLQIVATATVGWLEDTSNVMYGLWSYCPQISVCNSYGTEVKSKYKILNIIVYIFCK